MSAYLDTSAAVKMLIEEDESAVLAAWLDDAAADGLRIVSSVLLETELRRMAVREGLPQSTASALLDAVELTEPDRSLFHEAGVLPDPALRSLDALHLATAIRLGVDEVVTYDLRMAEAARELGLRVSAPA